MAQEIGVVGVVGLGTMGAGVAQVAAASGARVLAVDVTDAAVERGRARLERASARARDTSGPSARPSGPVSFGTHLADLADADIVVEAVPERLRAKQAVFAELDAVCRPDAILATCTSALSVTDISLATARPARVVGAHFFNPAQEMPLVEIVATGVTEPDVLVAVRRWVRSLGKHDVTVADRTGFIANALLFGYLNRAVGMLERGHASREDIDAAMRLGCGLPMGPLALLDMIGLDTAYQVLDALYWQDLARPEPASQHAPAPLLRQMVAAGLLGRKSGRGFYTYQTPDSATVVADPPSASGLATSPTQAAAALTPRPAGQVAVVGSGALAVAVVATFARAGFPVRWVARGDEQAANAQAELAQVLTAASSRGELAEADRAAALTLVASSSRLADVADADLVIEAVAEEPAVRRALFASFDSLCRPGAVLATAHADQPVTVSAAASGRPSDVIGLCFGRPPITTPAALVEVVHTVRTAPDVLATGLDVCRRIGAYPAGCPDRAGLIRDALLLPYLNSAVRMLAERYASADEIDLVMRAGCGHPAGPFELLDALGLDVVLAGERTLFEDLREPGLAPAPLLERLVAAGHLGHASGRGFRAHGQG